MLVLLRLWCHWVAMTETVVLLILRGSRYDTFHDYEEIPNCFLLCFALRRFVKLSFLLHWERTSYG